MTPPKQTVPVNVPTANETGVAGFQGDVTGAPVTNASAAKPADGAAASVDGTKPPVAATTADPANANSKDKKKKDAKNNKKDKKKQDQAPDQPPAATSTPAPATDPGPKP
jgi:hypothetical protein